MALNEDFVWTLKMIVEAGGVDRLAKALEEVGKTASGAHADLEKLGESARSVNLANALPDGQGIAKRMEAVTRLRGEVASTFELVRKNENIFQKAFEFEAEKPLRQIASLEKAIDAVQNKKGKDVEPAALKTLVGPEFSTSVGKALTEAKKAAETRLKIDTSLNAEKVHQEERGKALTELQEKAGNRLAATNLKNARILEDQNLAIARFNEKIDEGNAKFRIRQALLEAQQRGVGSVIAPTQEREALRHALLEDARKQIERRRESLKVEVDALPRKERPSAELKAQATLEREEKQLLAKVETEILEIELAQVKAMASFNTEIAKGGNTRRIRQAEQATALQGLVGPQQEGLKNEFRAALLAEQQRVAEQRRATVLASLDDLPDNEERRRARNRALIHLEAVEKEEVLAIDRRVLDVQEKQIVQAERLKAAATGRREGLETNEARLIQQIGKHDLIPDLGASIRLAQKEFEQRKGEITRQFLAGRETIQTLPEQDPNRNDLLKKNQEDEILALKNAELEKNRDIHDATLAQNKALETQRLRIEEINQALTARKGAQDVQFQRHLATRLERHGDEHGALSATNQAAKLEFDQQAAEIERIFAAEQKRIASTVPVGHPDRIEDDRLNEEARIIALKNAEFVLDEKLLGAEKAKRDAILQQHSAQQQLNETLVTRNLEARTRLNQFEVQTARVSEEARLDPRVRQTLAGVSAAQNALNPKNLLPRRLFGFNVREEVGNIADTTELRLQQRLDQAVLQKNLAESKINAERRRSLEEVNKQPAGSVTDERKALQLKVVEETATHSLRAIAAEFGPTNTKIKFFSDEISRLSAESAKFRQSSFDLGIASRQFLSVAGAGIAFLAGGAEKLGALSIRLGAFNAIAKQTPEELDQTRDAVIRLFGNVPVKNLDELGLALFNIQSSGFTAAESMNVLSTSSKLATLGMTDTNSAAKFLIQTLKAFDLSTNDSSLVASQLATILNTSVGEFDQVGQAIAKASAAAKLANQDLATLGAGFSVLTTAGGLTPRRAGDRISQLLRDITQVRTRENIGHLLKFDTVSPEGVVRPLEEIFGAFVKARKEGLLTGEAFNKIFTNRGSREAALILIENLEKVQEDVKAIRNPAEDFEETYKRATANVGSQFQILQNNLQTFAVAAATSISRPLGALSTLARGAAEFALGHKDLVSGIANAVIGVSGTIGALGTGIGIAQRFRAVITDAAVILFNIQRSDLQAASASELRNKQLNTENVLLDENRTKLLLDTEALEANTAARILASGAGTAVSTGTANNPRAARIVGDAPRASGGNPLLGGGVPGVLSTGTTTLLTTGPEILPVPGSALKTAGQEAKDVAFVGATESAAQQASKVGGVAAVLSTVLNVAAKGIVAFTVAATGLAIFGTIAESLRQAKKDQIDSDDLLLTSFTRLTEQQKRTTDQTSLTIEEELKLEEARRRLAEINPDVAAVLQGRGQHGAATLRGPATVRQRAAVYRLGWLCQ
jgi:TP901 family phage tail tape measure protein